LARDNLRVRYVTANLKQYFPALLPMKDLIEIMRVREQAEYVFIRDFVNEGIIFLLLHRNAVNEIIGRVSGEFSRSRTAFLGPLLLIYFFQGDLLTVIELQHCLNRMLKPMFRFA